MLVVDEVVLGVHSVDVRLIAVWFGAQYRQIGIEQYRHLEVGVILSEGVTCRGLDQVAHDRAAIIRASRSRRGRRRPGRR